MLGDGWIRILPPFAYVHKCVCVVFWKNHPLQRGWGEARDHQLYLQHLMQHPVCAKYVLTRQCCAHPWGWKSLKIFERADSGELWELRSMWEVRKWNRWAASPISKHISFSQDRVQLVDYPASFYFPTRDRLDCSHSSPSFRFPLSFCVPHLIIQ